MSTTVDTRAHSQTVALALLGALALLWGASYSFIKVGVATIPPITLIAGRTLIAGVLLLLIMRWRGVSMPTDGATWGRFAFQACLNSVIPWTLIAWGEGTLPSQRPGPPDPAKAVWRHRGHGGDLPDRRGQGLQSRRR